jgi:D-alanyl-D-alanine carboxypeptidase/D-alanyl-D-alanine-endopeptidase (penicillin-binding protein 4)
VIGGGDPCLDGHFTDDEPDRVFVGWAEALKRQGISAIDGDLVIDGRLFSGPIRPGTYPQDQENLQRWYSAPASAFAWNDNCIEVRVVPTRVGQVAEVQVRPHSPRIQVVNQTRTVGAKGDKAIWVARAADANSLTVTGSYSQATPWFPVSIYSDPELLAGDHLKDVLIRSGISVTGTVRLGPVDRRLGPVVIDHASPLIPALTVMNQHSQNFYGEQTLRVLGFERFHEGSVTAGCNATIAILRRLVGPLADQITLQDGSGLSYGNLGSAGAMAQVLLTIHQSAVGPQFRSTLKNKEVGKAKGYVKTGTLAVATCLVGYLDAPSGKRFAFALLFNRGETRDFRWAPSAREAICRAMAEE